MNTADILALPARTLDILKQIEKWKAGPLSQNKKIKDSHRSIKQPENSDMQIN